jgi:hypothetical protein
MPDKNPFVVWKRRRRRRRDKESDEPNVPLLAVST